ARRDQDPSARRRAIFRACRRPGSRRSRRQPALSTAESPARHRSPQNCRGGTVCRKCCAPRDQPPALAVLVADFFAAGFFEADFLAGAFFAAAFAGRRALFLAPPVASARAASSGSASSSVTEAGSLPLGKVALTFSQLT